MDAVLFAICIPRCDCRVPVYPLNPVQQPAFGCDLSIFCFFHREHSHA